MENRLEAMAYRDLQELDRSIFEYPRLHVKLDRMLRWRGLFDPYSAEYKVSGIKKKISLLKEIIQETRFSAERILSIIYNYFYYSRKRPDIAQACYEGAAMMLQDSLFRKLTKGGPK